MVLPNRAQALPFILLILLKWYSHFLFQVWPYILVYLVNLSFSHFFNIELGEFYPFKPKVAKVLFLGQDMVYKQSVILKLFDESIPWNETSQYLTSCVSSIGGIKFNFFDLGEHSIARRVWRDYCAKMDAVVYIVNANTRNRELFLGPREELNALLSDEAFANVPFLIFGITTAEPSSCPEEELCSLLDLTNITTGNGRVDLADANACPLEVIVAESYNKRQYLDGFKRLSKYIK
ncbi:GTP-binding protein SAR2 [Quercus suber]|uniref:GTP-binding protein SAR2 n=1 Tax=Quercus suber TaxID=58331 RepID=UPI000CE1B4CB|nr:GTP-binding protein SAR2-like isoform X1 [Quercus suber]POE59455.1 gtp-binding protein sar2 [Quercus suber]